MAWVDRVLDAFGLEPADGAWAAAVAALATGAPAWQVARAVVASPIAEAPRAAALAWLAGPDPTAAALLFALPRLHGAEADGAAGGWDALGPPAARALALLEALAALWLPAAGSAGPDPLGPLLEVARAVPEARPALALALAGDTAPPARRRELAAALGADPVLAALDAAWAARLEALHAARPDREGALADAFADGLDACWRAARASAGFQGLVLRVAAAPAWTPDRAAADARMARAFLDAEPTWRRAWDVREEGLHGWTGRMVGRFFPVGLVVQALLDAGEPGAEARGRALLATLPAAPIRYYDACPAIPPDSDDLGLALWLAARVGGVPPATREAWIAPLAANRDPEGGVPTWLHRVPGAGAHLPIDWLGDRCTAVGLSLAVGLLALREPADGVAAALLARAAARWTGDSFADCFHYAPAYAMHLTCRALPLLDAAPLPRAVRALARATAASVTDRLRRSQGPDGGWGSPQATALALDAWIVAGDPPAEAVAAALRCLGDAQLPDGSWPEEPLYVIPGKGATDRRYASREVTTALGLRALRRGHAALAGRPSP